jgi:hypothetical protein
VQSMKASRSLIDPILMRRRVAERRADRDQRECVRVPGWVGAAVNAGIGRFAVTYRSVTAHPCRPRRATHMPRAQNLRLIAGEEGAGDLRRLLRCRAAKHQLAADNADGYSASR